MGLWSSGFSQELLGIVFCRLWEHIRSEVKIRKVIAAQQEALTELRAISEDLYQQAIQVGIDSYNFRQERRSTRT